jgi:hypothetical protein
LRRSLTALLLAPGVALALCPHAGAATSPAACFFANNRIGEPAQIATPVPDAVVADFAALRRPAAAGDALPPLNLAADELTGTLATYYPAAIRLLLEEAGVRYFLVTGYEREPTLVPACLSPSELHERARLVQLAHERATTPTYCIVELGASGETPDRTPCQQLPEIESTSPLFEPLGERGPRPLAQLVPDGVAAVRVDFAAHAPAVIAVREDLLLYDAPNPFVKVIALLEREARRHSHAGPAEQRRIARRLLPRVRRLLAEAEPTRLEWLDASGTAVRTIVAPHGSAGPLATLREAALLERTIAAMRRARG